jgi:F0F1-type ATP synthase assembly protein I
MKQHERAIKRNKFRIILFSISGGLVGVGAGILIGIFAI